jgi:hypothetical protein
MRTTRIGSTGLVIALSLAAAACGSGSTKASVKTSGDGFARSAPIARAPSARPAHTSADAGAASVPYVAGENGSSPAAPPHELDSALNAGSVDDNEKWDDYLRYRDEFLRTGTPVHDVDVTTRETVHVVDRDNKPVLGAHVELRSGDTVVASRVTYADGRVLLFPPKSDSQNASPHYTMAVSYGDSHVEQPLDPETHDHTVKLAAARVAAQAVPLDVVFLIDATGSMGDEIEQLKANMVSVAKQVNKLSPRPDLRFGMTVYRDRGDAFVTRDFDLTSDVDAFVQQLHGVVADGGGDTPESVNAGLHDALNAQHWRGDDTVKLVFLVGDAAPHLDYAHDYDYAEEMEVAAQRGIKIDPIASSGLDDQGEYVFRQLAQYTTGRFNFLTYGADGHSPGTLTTHHVSDYAVLSLDQLVVKLVEDELKPLN